MVEEELGGKPRRQGQSPQCRRNATFDARIGLAHAKFGRGTGIVYAQPGIFVRQLGAIANSADSEVDVDIGDVGDGLIAVKNGI
jgi:hypothetical protein